MFDDGKYRILISNYTYGCLEKIFKNVSGYCGSKLRQRIEGI